jgi:hypothetical protein
VQHAAYVDEAGVLHYQHIAAPAAAAQDNTCAVLGASSRPAATVSTLLRYQLQYRPDEGAAFEPVEQPWAFEFVPGSPGDVLIVQAGSCRILYASLPKQDSTSSELLLFGAHTAPIQCLSVARNHVLSGCADGTLKLWRLADGQLSDVADEPMRAGITAIEPLGPLLVRHGCGRCVLGIVLCVLCCAQPRAVRALQVTPSHAPTHTHAPTPQRATHRLRQARPLAASQFTTSPRAAC